MKLRKVLVLNGPNLDMLGTREPEVYGRDTLESLENDVREYGELRNVKVTCFQSNSEAKLISKIHSARGKYDGIVYNPGAHTHYSYALRDAVGSIDVPVVEVHLSDVSTREAFRRVSVIAPACIAQVKGMGVNGYRCAIDILCENEGLVRLGEGFQVPDGEDIVIAAALQDEQGDAVSADGFGEAPLRGGETRPSAPLPDEPEPVAVQDLEEAASCSRSRLAAVRAACGRLGIGSVLVRDTSNVRWLTAFDGVFDEERAHALLVSGARAALHTDSRYSNAVRVAAARTGSIVEVDDARTSHAQFAFDVLSDGGASAQAGKMGIEDTITYAEFVQVVDCFGAENLAPTTDLVLGLRAVKDEGEVARLRAAQAVTDAAFTHIIGFMRPGMTEREVRLELEDYLVRHGADGIAFRSIVATGANGADPHAVPGETRLEAGQCVVMDFGAVARGYCSDMTRTVFLGVPDDRLMDAWEVLRRANEKVEALLRPGITGAEAHALAEQTLAEGGFAGRMGHGLGHGVGIDVHELPVLGPRNDAPLVEGNVVTVEPGIYVPGEFGMRLEDFGVVTADGFDVFTQSTHEMVVL